MNSAVLWTRIYKGQAILEKLNLIIISMVFMAVLALLLGLGLSFAYRRLKLEEDPWLKEIIEILPGLNCGACGCASCEDFAGKLAEAKVPVNGCIAGGEKVAANLEKKLGRRSDTPKNTKKARFKCHAREQEKIKTADYLGLKSCLNANSAGSSFLACFQGCFGFGDCMKKCPVSAIEITDGRPMVSIKKCIGCGLCVKACPRDIIDIVDLKSDAAGLVAAGCNCTQTAAVTMRMCKSGCIACEKCRKICPVEAVTIENSKAVISPLKCIACEKCIGVCPTKVIYAAAE